MRKTKAFMIAALTAAGVAVCMSAPAFADAKETETITLCLDWTPNTNHTGFYAAVANGYYEMEGLTVEIVQPPEGGAVTMCASGQAQFAIDAQDTTAASYDLDEPLGVTAVAALLQHNTSGIISRSGEGLDHPAGLEGHTYSTWEIPTELSVMETVVTQDGGDWEKVTLIPNDLSDEPAALKANQTDAVWVFYGWSCINSEVEGVDCDFFYFKDINDVFDYYTPTLIANDEFLQKEPDTVKAFLRATQMGYEYAAENPEEAAQILIDGDDTGALAGSEELVKKSQEYISGQYMADEEKWGYIDPERWNTFYAWLYEEGLTEHDLSDSVGFTNDFLPSMQTAGMETEEDAAGTAEAATEAESAAVGTEANRDSV